MSKELLYYAIGYCFSIVVGNFFVLRFSRMAWSALGEVPENAMDMPYRWTSSLAGIVERVIYTSSILFSAKEFIAVWLAFKIAAQWKRWEDKEDLNKVRAIFHVFITGTGLSLMYGVVGGLIVEWLKNGEYAPAIAFPMALILLNLLFIWIANRNKKVVSKKK